MWVSRWFKSHHSNTRLYIDSPYLKGRYEAWCMENPVYDLFVGYIPRSKPPDKINQNWKGNAVGTRPGVQSDIRRVFFQSCDICKRTLQKSKVSRISLERMSLIKEPFQWIAVDRWDHFSDNGQTLVYYATRYPEATALPSIETERATETLMEMFWCTAREADRYGSQFTSSLMNEVSRLTDLKQWTKPVLTTPYHPKCNGLVERFNGTLKIYKTSLLRETQGLG